MWQWLKGQARREKKSLAQILYEPIARYETRVQDLGFVGLHSPGPGVATPIESKASGLIPYKADPGASRRIYGTHPALWSLAKARVKLENKIIGELVNDVIDSYRQSAGESGAKLEMTSLYELVKGVGRSIRSVDHGL